MLAAAVVGAFVWTAAAQTWKAGETTVTLDNGTLTVSGKGKMYYSMDRPWKDKRDLITALIIEDGVTEFKHSAFESLTRIKSVTIPSSVTSIPSSAFFGCDSLVSVTIQNGVNSIGRQAFQDCKRLQSVEIPNTVTSIGEGAFKMQREGSTSLKSITIPGSVTSIEDGAFCGCSGLESITIPDGVKDIGSEAFGRCKGLATVAIPATVKNIGRGPFMQCANLTSINVHKSNTAYISVDGVLFNKAKDTLIQYPCAKKDGAYTIPNGVKVICEYAFSGSSGLTAVTIPGSVVSIEDGAFNMTGLTEVTIPNGVTDVGSAVFWRCGKLTSATISKSVTTIGSLAFEDCPLLATVVSLNPAPPVVGSIHSGRDLFYKSSGLISNAVLYVPKDYMNVYRRKLGWNNFRKIMPIEK